MIRKYLEQQFFFENGDARNLENCVEAHGVRGSSEERRDAKMLLDPLEEEFDLKGQAKRKGMKPREVEVSLIHHIIRPPRYKLTTMRTASFIPTFYRT